MKFYVIWEGKKKWIFSSREECKDFVVGYRNARYKAFKTKEQAQQAFENGYEMYYQAKPKEQWKTEDIPFERNSIAVDAACSGNPWKLEYQWIDLVTEKTIFYEKFPLGTNNIGEFLAIVHGLIYLKKHKSDKAIYSDSKHAMKWVKEKKCKTQLENIKQTKKLFEIIKRAEGWLENNEYKNKILKRHTEERGEIPADFGNK